MMRSAINIILVADEGSPDLRFIEAELDNGISVDIGERTDSDGVIRWRIKAEDIVSVNIRRADSKDWPFDTATDILNEEKTMQETCRAFIERYGEHIPFVSLVNILRAYEYFEVGNFEESERILLSNRRV